MQVTNWNFIMEDPSGNEVMVPPERGLPNLAALTAMVLSYINIYDNATQNQYSLKQRELAAQAGKPFESYIRKVIEHQFCLRNKNQGVDCWSDGLGDDIHNTLSKVDGFVEKAPTAIRNVIEKAISAITPSRSKSFGGCSSCGGGRSFSPSQDNLGRAGKLNRK